MMSWLLLVDLVLLFSFWLFLVERTRGTTRIVLFQAAIGALVLIAATLGKAYSLNLGALQLTLGNIAYAAVIMASVAMFAATRDPRVIRDAIRLVLAVNLIAIGVLAISALALQQPNTQLVTDISTHTFSTGILPAVFGGALHIVQLLLLAFVMERTRRTSASPTLLGVVTVASFILVLGLDGAIYPALVTFVQPELAPLLSSGWSGVAAKLLLGALYAVPLSGFLLVHQRSASDDREADLRGLLFAPRRAVLDTVTRAVDEREELVTRLDDVVAAITDWLLGVDADWCTTFVNATAAESVGADPGELIGRSLWDAFPNIRDTEVERALRSVATSGVAATLYTEALIPGTSMDLTIYPARDGLVLYANDVSERLEAQRRIEAANAAEQTAADRLREVDLLRNNFLTSVSHELRSPLTVIRGLSETLQRKSSTLDTNTRTRIEAALVANSLRLSNLLDDLLDVERVVRGMLVMEPDGCDVSSLVRDVVAVHPSADRITVELPDELPALVDPHRMERIVVNLLDNAAKYAPDGSIGVALHADDDQLLLEVIDEGPGIPRTDLDRVFEPFHRADTNHPQPGTGIGLTLVREFAELHGGRAWAEPTEHVGAHFCVKLPLTPTAESAAN